MGKGDTYMNMHTKSIESDTSIFKVYLRNAKNFKICVTDNFVLDRQTYSWTRGKTICPIGFGHLKSVRMNTQL